MAEHMRKVDGVVEGTLHQILITEPGTPFPERYHAQRAFLRSQFAEYRLWTSPELEAFLAEHYDPRVLAAFRAVRPFAYKADLARYCLLHALGGWYVDYGIRRLVLPNEIPLTEFIGFRDRPRHSRTAWAVQNGIMWARPQLPALASAVMLSVRNIEQHLYGMSPLSPTGPPVLGQALAMHGDRMRMHLGDFIDLTPEHDRDNLAYVGEDGWIWAFFKDELPGTLWIDGTNRYADMWHSRVVYSETPDERPRVLVAGDDA